MDKRLDIIATMRKQGSTLQEIGDQVRVTRERVRQILSEHHGSLPRGLIVEDRLAKLLGCSCYRLTKLRVLGITKPRHTFFFYLYDRAEAEKAMIALQRNCPHCGASLSLKHLGKYCRDCQIECKRNPYPFRSEKSKKVCFEATKRWRKARKEKHYSETDYVVVNKGPLPVGTTFKAVGCIRRHIILADGTEIPMVCVRKLKINLGG